MRNCIYLFIITWLLSLIVGSADAKPTTRQVQEQVKINGVVKDEGGDAIAGATVFVVENNAIGAVADREGKYTLTVPVGSTLNVSFMGFESIERKVVKGKLRYFPYVEKLMPMIKYLSEKMGFNDNLIKALCTFKEIPVKGKLYSTMFNQSFSADGAVCSLKEDKEGRFDLKIDGVSHHSWFRRKRDEFMEALGLPTSRRQNRGLKL